MAINENMIHCPFLSITKSTSASHKKNHVFFSNYHLWKYVCGELSMNELNTEAE